MKTYETVKMEIEIIEDVIRTSGNDVLISNNNFSTGDYSNPFNAD